jgi:hypothetical protein
MVVPSTTRSLSAAMLAVKQSKCSFGETSVAYLGHVITAQGVTMDAEKVAVVQARQTPRSMCAVRGFLGLTGYYRKFIQSYGDIAGPLMQLLKREAFCWTLAVAAAFKSLKAALTTAHVLQLPDFTNTFMVDCDASGSGFGAVLHQGGGPIAFFSRACAPHHAKLAAYEWELIGLVKVVRHWRPYLWPRDVIVRTYHYSLKYLLNQRLSTIPQHAWVNKLFGYQFRVEFKLGRQNAATDALSRRDEEVIAVHAISTPEFKFFDQFRQESSTLPDIAARRTKIDAGTADKAWRVVDGIVVREGHIFMPASSKLWPTILEQAHGMGHEGIQKTLQRLRTSFFIPHDTKLV